MPIYMDDPSAPPSDGTDAFATDNGSEFIDTYAPDAGGSGMPSAGAGQATDPTDPMQFRLVVGWRTVTRDAPSHMTTGDPEYDSYGTGTMQKQKPRYATIGELMDRFNRMTIAERHDIYRNLLIAGIMGSDRQAPDPSQIDEYVKYATADEVASAYYNMLTQVGDLKIAGTLVTPDEFLRDQMGFRLQAFGVNWTGDMNAFDGGFLKYIKESGQGDAAFGGGGSGAAPLSPKPKPYTDTYTQKSVNFMDPMDAKALTRGMLQQELGRDPTQAEYEEFVSAINAAEKAHPSVTTTTTKYGYDKENPNTGRATNFDNYGVLSRSSVTHGGITEAGLNQLMYQKAISNPDWAEWQAMGTYFPALLAALGPTTGG